MTPRKTPASTDRLDVRALDISDFDSIPRVVNEILRDHSRIDVLVNNAGFVFAGFAEDIRLAELRQQMDTNFFGHVAVTQAVLPAMRAQRSGHIIMVSSETGRMGSPGIGSYAASKFALEGWSETLRLETRALGIKVVLVEPGAFKTDIWDRNTRLNEELRQRQLAQPGARTKAQGMGRHHPQGRSATGCRPDRAHRPAIPIRACAT